ncbi:hypothetical protein SAMN04515620_12062 [Collimonas sp. OK607]|uniref:hypothetical protein n=1 Tax=Collimonas sp. OK607 TaxID=1798194 RepID=UPI0008E38092|nr:hypothetical protein [Collimonas sp. OK607]SFB14130.1 hypothetical protein SAMN04515620_12062 [Collimonas sp. OK607]
MKTPDIRLWIAARAVQAVSIEKRHEQVLERMSQIGPPLGFAGLELPSAPDCGDGLAATYGVKLPIRGLKFAGDYIFRGERFNYQDNGRFDDYLRFGFKVSNRALNYKEIVHEHFPRVIDAFRGYRAFLAYGEYYSAYCGGYVPSDDGSTAFDAQGNAVLNNLTYNCLLADKTIDLDGRNNIYVLSPAVYWDNELCQRALGYGPDEVIRRLNGLVPKVEFLSDGVYIVFNDDHELSFEAFLFINEYFKPVLGLI